MSNFRYFILFTLILCVSILEAQEIANFRFRKFQVDDGLSESAIYCMLQDAHGFIWFGTKDGLNRYDGSTCRVFRTRVGDSCSIGNNFIRSIAEGKDRALYVGTDVGLYVFNPIDECFKSINLKLIHSAINSLVVDKQGQVWIGTMSQGVFVYRPDLGTVNPIHTKNCDNEYATVWQIYQDQSEVIWIGERQGLLRYNFDTKQLDPIVGLYENKNNSNNEILSILEDEQGTLWLGTWANGLRAFNKHTNTYKSHFGNKDENTYITHIRSLFNYSKTSLLLGSDDGLFLFDQTTQKCKRIDKPNLSASLSDQNIYSMMKDRENGIWIGTYFGGVNYLNPARSDMEYYSPSNTSNTLAGKAISQFCEDDNSNLWIATEDAGVHYFNTTTRQFSQPIKTSYHNTHALLLNKDDLWIGTFSRGIDIYNIKTKKLHNLRTKANDIHSLTDDCVFSIYKTHDGSIYVGTPAGLNKYNEHKNNFDRIPEVTSFIYDMKEDFYGNLWVATYADGIVKRDATTHEWIYYNKLLPPSHPIVNSKLIGLYIDSKRRLWASSEGRGIFLYNYAKDSFENISEAQGLPNNVVYGILDDQFGDLWVSCNKGIVKFNTSDLTHYKLYNKGDGLQSNQFNYKSSYKSKEGKLYFGGVNGFNCFYPQELKKNNVVPPVEITQLKLLGKTSVDLDHQLQTKINKKELIKLPYNKSSFTISYVSLSFNAQAKNQYAYMLEGAEKMWNQVGNTKSVTYINLSPGKYTFKVKASNNDGLWNNTGCEIPIEILPPFWLTIYAKLLYGLLLIGISFLILKRYHSKNKLKQEQHLEAFKLEQETLAFQSKIDFFTTIAHEIRTPLSLITAPLEEIINSRDGNNNTQQNLSIIEKNSDRLSELINQLLDFRKMDSTEYTVTPERIDLIKFVTNIYERFRKTSQSNKIDLILSRPEEKELLVISDVDALTKILGNLLTNALKFTNNKIILSLLHFNNHYELRVEDNGAGVPDEFKNSIFEPFFQIKNQGNTHRAAGTGIGLSLVKHLSKVLNGSVSVEDVPEGGALFVFRFTNLPAVHRDNHEYLNSESEPVFDMDDKKPAILVVDDNTEMLQFIQTCLNNDFTTDIASGAKEAMQKLEDHAYKLIITDLMMPDMNGIEFTKTLKTNSNFSHIPIILLSAKTHNEDKIEGLEAGAEAFIEKPFSTYYLKAQISSLLANRRVIIDTFNQSPLASYTMLACNKGDELFLSRLNMEIEKHLSDVHFSIESLSETLCISRSNLQRKLKSICDVTPGEYLRNYRLKQACKFLLEGNARINEVAFEVGFNSASYFTKCFLKQFGTLPKEFIKQHQEQPNI